MWIERFFVDLSNAIHGEREDSDITLNKYGLSVSV
jgi:hypothetical protein